MTKTALITGITGQDGACLGDAASHLQFPQCGESVGAMLVIGEAHNVSELVGGCLVAMFGAGSRTVRGMPALDWVTTNP